MACSSSSYKDVNISNFQFQPVEVILNGKRVTLVDSYGNYLEDQKQKLKEQIQQKQAEEEKLQREGFQHPKVKLAEEYMQKKKDKLKRIDEEINMKNKEIEVLQDLLIANMLDLQKLEQIEKDKKQE